MAFNFATEVSANITLYAKWEINYYDITVNDDGGGSGSKADREQASIGQPVTLTEGNGNGYIFVGWRVNGEVISGNTFSMPASDVMYCLR